METTIKKDAKNFTWKTQRGKKSQHQDQINFISTEVSQLFHQENNVELTNNSRNTLLDHQDLSLKKTAH